MLGTRRSLVEYTFISAALHKIIVDHAGMSYGVTTSAYREVAECLMTYLAYIHPTNTSTDDRAVSRSASESLSQHVMRFVTVCGVDFVTPVDYRYVMYCNV